MSINFTPRLQLAINFAAESHRGQNRKNDDQTPYISHPYSVMLIASEYTENEDVFISCLLHDTVEDCGVSFDEIESLFGKNVREIVYHVTEPVYFGSSENTLTWKERKGNYIGLLEVGPREALLVAVCDKLHNMSTLTPNIIHKGTFWFLDNVLEILTKREKELPEGVLNKYKNTLDGVKSAFA